MDAVDGPLLGPLSQMEIHVEPPKSQQRMDAVEDATETHWLPKAWVPQRSTLKALSGSGANGGAGGAEGGGLTGTGAGGNGGGDEGENILR